MVGSVNNTGSINFAQKVYASSSSLSALTNKPFNSFDDEDQAIISADAKLQYEQEKYNSGEGDPVDLAVTRVTSENQVEANANVINTKSRMLEAILGLDHGDSS